MYCHLEQPTTQARLYQKENHPRGRCFGLFFEAEATPGVSGILFPKRAFSRETFGLAQNDGVLTKSELLCIKPVRLPRIIHEPVASVAS